MDNSGLVSAAQAELKAAGGNLYALAINNTGVVRANTVVNEGGRIVLKAEGGTTSTSGNLDASGTLGGTVHVLGAQVALEGAAVVNVSGDAGGGVALIGGGFQGKESGVPNSKRSVVGPDAIINANAGYNGDGGDVVVWADGLTKYYGNITAEGGIESGDGGNVEVSGKTHLAFDGGVNVGATSGLTGSILLDPRDLTITSSGFNDSLVTSTGLLVSSPDVNTDVTITDSAIEALTGNITLTAWRNLSINSALSLSNLGSGETAIFSAGGNLTIGAAVSTGGGSMTFRSSTGGVNSGSATLTILGPTTGGDVTFSNPGSSGNILLSASIPNSGNDVTFTQKVSTGADLTISGADLTFGALNADATSNNRSFTVTPTGTATFNGRVGDTGLFGSLLVNSSGATKINSASIKSTAQVYKNPVTVGSNVNLTGANVQFDSTVNAAAASSGKLRVNATANAVFNGAIGATGGTITSISTDSTGKTTLKGGSVTATVQNFNNPVTLGADTSFNGSTISFGSSLDGDLEANNREVTISASTKATITSGLGLGPDGTLGTSDDVGFGKLTTSGTGNTLFKGAGVKADVQSYGNNTLIGADQTFSGTTITFDRNINGNGSGKILTLNASGTTTFNRPVGNTTQLGGLVTDSAGTTFISGASIKSTAQTFNDPVLLGNNVTLTGTTVTFENTVDGDVSDDRTLRINATTTEIKSGARIGSSGVLKSLITNQAGNTLISVSDGTVKATTMSFADTVKLGVNTTLVGSTITILKAVINEPALTPRTLAINASLVGTLGGTIGASGDPLTSLTTDGAGSTTFKTSTINVTTQTYNDPVTLTGNATIDGTTITFANTVDSNIANSRNMTLNTGVTTFSNTIGATKKLGLLKTESTAGTTTISGGSVGVKTQTYEGAVSLTADTTLTGTTVTFSAAFAPSADATYGLTIDASGVSTIANAFGTGNKFTTLTTSAAGTMKLGANVTTSGAQSYNDAVTLESSASSLSITLTGTDITFGKTVNSDNVSNTRNLTIAGSGITTFKSNVGNSKKLSSITSNGGGTTVLSGGIYKATTQTYTDALTIAKTKVTVTAEDGAGGGAATFGSTVDGNTADNRTLIVDSDGATTFTGVVGGTTRLKALTTDDVSGQTDTTVLNGGAVTSVTQTYNDAVTLGADTTVSGTTVTFAGTLDSTGSARDLTANVSGVTKFGSDVGKTLKLDVLTTDIAGSTVVEAAEVNAATQKFNDSVTVGANTTLQGVTGGTAATAVSFGKTLDADDTAGNRTLTINDTTTTFGGIVGGSGVFSSLTTDSTGSTVINTSGINATAQTFGDNVTVGATVTHIGSTVQFDGSVNADAAANARALSINASGGAIFKGTVGATEKLGTMTVASSSGNTQFFTGGTSVHATTQVYSDSVVLNDNITFEGTNITFNDTLDGNGANRNITLTSSGVTKLNGVVGPSNVGTLTSDAGGTTKMGANITTFGAQTFNDPVVIAADVTLNGTAANLVFNDTVNADLARNSRSLTLTTSGAITLGGAVGGTDPLGTLVQTAGASAVNLDGGTVNIGTQTYNNNVTLGADATLKGKNITFVGTVNGTQALTVSATGTTDFQSTLGDSSAITTLLTDNGGTTQLAGNVTTSANQTLNDAVVLAAAVAFDSGATVTLGSTVDGAFALSTPDNLVVSGAIGSSTQVASVSVTGTSSLGADVKTSGNQTYTGLATLTDDVTLTVSGSLDATAGINGGTGNFDLVLDVASPKIGGTAGTLVGANLSSVGDLTLSQAVTPSGTVTTVGEQTYNGAVNLTATTTLSGTAINLNSTVNGAQSLTLAGSGVSAIAGVVGGTTAPTTVTVNGGGLTSISANVTVAGDLVVDDIVLLGANATLATTGGAGNTISLKSITGSGYNLTLNSSDTGATAVTLAETISGVATFSAITGGGEILLNKDVTTTATQTYNGPVKLGADVTLTGTTITTLGTVDATTGGTEGLTVTGDAVVSGIIGGTTPLELLTISGTTALNTTAITTATGAGQTYTGAVTMGADSSLASGATPITFGSTVTQSGNDNLGIVSTAARTFTGVVNLGSGNLDVAGGGTSVLTANVTAMGGLDLDDAVTLAGDVTLTGALSTASIDGSSGNYDLNFVTANPRVGGTAAKVDTALITNVGDITFSDTVTLIGTGLTTIATQTYTGAVSVDADLSLAGTDITFSSTVDAIGSDDLTLNASGTTTFASTAGVGDSFGVLTTGAAGTLSVGGNITAATITLNGAITLAADSTMTGAVTTGSTIDATAAGAQDLRIAGATVFGGAVGGTTALGKVTVTSTSTVPGNITTSTSNSGTGVIVLNGLITLGGNSVFTAPAAADGFGTSIGVNGSGSNYDLTIVSIEPKIGGTVDKVETTRITNVGDLTFGNSVTLFGSGMTTTATQTYTGAVTVDENTTLAGTDITFSSTVDASGAENLTVNAIGATIFTGVVGGLDDFGVLTTDSAGTLVIGANVSAATIALNDPITLTADATLTGAVTTGSTIDATAAGAQDLTVTGATVFGGDIGGTTPLGAVSTSTTTSIGGNVTTSTSNSGTGNQTYTGVSTLTAATTITAPGNLVLGDTVQGAFNLKIDSASPRIGATASKVDVAKVATSIVNLTFEKAVTLDDPTAESLTTAGTQTYNGAVTLSGNVTVTGTGGITTGSSAPISGTGNLKIVSAAVLGADVSITGALETSDTVTLPSSVTTSTTQTYTSVATLAGTTALTGTTISFGAPLVGAANNLTLDFSGNASTIALANITGVGDLTLSSATTISGSLSTLGTQTYSGALTLDASATFASSGTGTDGDITFEGTIDGDAANRAFTVNTAGTTWFKKAVGASTALDILTTDSSTPGGTTKIGASITTDDSQTYNDNVQLMSSVVLAGTAANGGAGTITLNAVNGSGNNLTLSGAGDTKLLGNMTDLSTLASDNGGNTIVGVNTSSGSIAITSSSSQTFVDATTINQPTQFSGTPVTFLGTQTIDPNGSINP